MKTNKLLSFLLVAALTFIAGCNDSSKPTIKIGVMAEPGRPIVEFAKKAFEEKGYRLEILTYSAFDLVNPPLSDGSIDANLFQHEPYLANFNKTNSNKKLAVAKKLYLPEYAVYSKKFDSLDAITSGLKALVPDDASNLSRSLYILDSLKVIELNAAKKSANEIVNEADIIKNSKNLVITKMASSLIAASLINDDTAFGVINASFAIPANLATSAKILGKEVLQDPLVNANILAVREEDLEKQWVKDLVTVLTSKDCFDFITSRYPGIITPSFTRE